ncbi:uncharacterized protein TNCT_21691 [Trichonephila clavata]|uniref:Uncharacterized protein n=1 Tax=Trichonephila clavata TaxID=2740835 RepID=A0A8X6HB08_TRICU|nr:uncharacterized protein TNCT_21691 [Trichonephila clavata]
MQARSVRVVIEIKTLASESAAGTKSARETARWLGLPPSLIRNILNGILNQYPYKLQSCHELLPSDTIKREALTSWAVSKMELYSSLGALTS